VSDLPEEGGLAQFELVPPKDTGDTPTTYANFFQATISPVDVTLHLGWYSLPPLTEQPTEAVRVPVRPTLKVSIPVGLLPGIINVLQSQLEAFEQLQRSGQAQEVKSGN
jgi:hypothetical protein